MVMGLSVVVLARCARIALLEFRLRWAEWVVECGLLFATGAVAFCFNQRTGDL